MSATLAVAAVGSNGGKLATGVAVAMLAAAMYDVGYVLEKQALQNLPALRANPVSLLRAGFSSRRWLTGFVVMLVALGLQVLALTLAPVSVVQPILAAGLIGLAAVGGIVLDEKLERRHLLALILVLAAVMAVAVSAHAGEVVASGVHISHFVMLAGPAAVLATTWSWLGIRSRDGVWSMLAVAGGAGLLYGIGAVAEKAVATHLVSKGVAGGALASLATPYPWLFVVSTAGGMVVFQIGLQRHAASMMATFVNVASTVCALLGAEVVFGESVLPGGWWSLARIAGFAAVLGAVFLMATSAGTGPKAALESEVAFSLRPPVSQA